MRRVGVLLAAGASRRFGPQNKLLASFRGQALVRWAAQALIEAGCDVTTAIICAPEIVHELPPGMGHQTIAPGQDMAASFRAAIAFARQQQAGRLLVCLGDMPNVSPAMLRQMLERDESAACICDGVRMPPLLLVAEDFEQALLKAEGDRGARAFIRSLPATSLMEVDRLACADVDLPADLVHGA